MYANDLRNSYLEMLSQHKFSYRIDVQPQGNVKIDALTQAMRQMLFGLNRKYLRVRKFGHFSPEHKFWALCVKEGDNLSIGDHYHLLLHSPVERIDWINDILLPWSNLRMRRINKSRPLGRSGKTARTLKDPMLFSSLYPTWVKTEGWGHVPCDELDNVPLLRVERCTEFEASLIYNLKDWRPSDPENFIIGLSET